MAAAPRLTSVGSIDVLAADALSRSEGRDFLPFPLMTTGPSPFANGEEYERHGTSVREAFRHGDLRTFRDCLVSFVNFDIRIECMVRHDPPTPPIRIVAHRKDDKGFLVEQRPDEDVLDVFALSPFDLGAAVAERSGLIRPGRNPKVVVPEWGARSPSREVDDAVAVADKVRAAASDVVPVSASEVTVYATVQSHWRHTRKWGLDRRRAAVVWLRTKGDGDYVYGADYGFATPLTRALLAERIDRLVAADAAILRDHRRRV